MSPPLRIAFVASAAYPMFRPEVKASVGGMEMRAWRLAQGLSRRDDVEVAVVVGDYGQRAVERVGAVELWNYSRLPWFVPASLRHHPPLEWLAGRLHWARQVTLQGRIARYGRPVIGVLPADVMCPYGINHLTADVVRTRRRRGKCSILMLASDSDLDPVFQVEHGPSRHDGERAEYGHIAIHRSNLVVAQTVEQQRTCESRFGRRAVVLPNPFEPPPEEQADFPVNDPRRDVVLWVGRAEAFHKRPLLLLELARRFPAEKFLMVMNPRDPAVEAEVRRTLPANVTILQHVPYAEMRALYARAKVFVSTSVAAMEGFPNVFLEAGHFGVPVASLESDPEGMFDADGCGLACHGSLDELTAAVRRLLDDRATAATCVGRMRERLRERHSQTAVCERMLEYARLALTLP